MQCNCGKWRIVSTSPVTMNCPLCGSVISIRGGTTSPIKSIAEITTGSAWTLLHSYAPTNASKWNPTTARQWYDTEWTQLIPSCGECRQHWAELTKQHPPDFLSPRAFFEWGWARHNDVSTLHSHRPTISLAEAYQLYWPDAQF